MLCLKKKICPESKLLLLKATFSAVLTGIITWSIVVYQLLFEFLYQFLKEKATGATPIGFWTHVTTGGLFMSLAAGSAVKEHEPWLPVYWDGTCSNGGKGLFSNPRQHSLTLYFTTVITLLFSQLLKSPVFCDMSSSLVIAPFDFTTTLKAGLTVKTFFFFWYIGFEKPIYNWF